MTRRRLGEREDGARLTRLHEHVAPDLLRYFLRRVDEPADASDLLAEAFVVAWRRIRSLPVDDHEARLWMFGVARRVHANWKRGRHRAHRLAAPLRGELALAIGNPAVHGTSVDDAIDVRAAVATLPADQREVVVLVYWDGFSVADAARLLDIPLTTARGRMHRARRALQRLLGPDDAAEPDDAPGSAEPVRESPAPVAEVVFPAG